MYGYLLDVSVLEDDGIKFLRNVGNKSPSTKTNIPENPTK
jgi:hypothetical protein